MQPLSGNQRPDLLTSLMNMSFVLRLPRQMHLAISSAYVPRLPTLSSCYKTLTFCSLLTRCTIPCACHAKRHLNAQKWSEHVLLTFWLGNLLRATTACTFWTSHLPKVLRHWGALYVFTSKCASRQNCVHFFDISTSKSGPRLQFFTLLTSKSASRHNGVQFLISHLARWLRTCGFSLLFDPPEPQIIGKNTVNRDFSTCSRACIFFPLTLSLLWSSSSSLLFSSLTVPTSAFPSGHTVGSLTSKLPSNIYQ